MDSIHCKNKVLKCKDKFDPVLVYVEPYLHAFFDSILDGSDWTNSGSRLYPN
jgi:hypothetical protein